MQPGVGPERFSRRKLGVAEVNLHDRINLQCDIYYSGFHEQAALMNCHFGVVGKLQEFADHLDLFRWADRQILSLHRPFKSGG